MQSERTIKNAVTHLIVDVSRKPIEDGIPLYNVLSSLTMIELLIRIEIEFGVNLEEYGGPTLIDLENLDNFARFVYACMSNSLDSEPNESS